MKYTPYLFIGTLFGAAAGLFNVLGFIRWVFVTKALADMYMNPSVSQATGDAAIVNFQVLNTYFGVSVGETLGYISMGVWIVTICVTMLQTRFIHPAIPIPGILCGLGTLTGIFEWADVPIAAEINAYAIKLWLVVMIIIGFHLVLKQKKASQNKNGGGVTSTSDGY